MKSSPIVVSSQENAWSILEDLTARNAILLNQARLDEKVKSAWPIDGRIFVISKQSDSVKKTDNLLERH